MGKDPSEINQEVDVDVREQLRQHIGQARDRVEPVVRNPLGMAIGATAIGFLVGLMIPVTRVEEDALPRVRDKINEQMRAVDLVERAGRVLDETKRAASQAMQEQAREASEALSARNEQT